MAEEGVERYIEVIGSALFRRPINLHRGTIKITVTTRKAKTGLELSLRLRDDVINALKSVGVDEGGIEDSGAAIGHSSWSGKKQLAHELRIVHKEMQVFANAMAAVEQVFIAEKPKILSGVKCDFFFTVDEPVYGEIEGAKEQALRDAIANARQKATLYAESASVQLGPVEQITEILPPAKRRREDRYEDLLDFDQGALGSGLYELGVDDSFVDYTEVSPRESSRIVQARVRFSLLR